jgi:hypothetical protein
VKLNIKSILSNRNFIYVIGLFILVILILIISGINNNYIKYDKLYISEIMPKNTYTLKDNYDEYSDYIELYNGYNHDINLNGYHISDSEFETNKWTFPNITIKANDYLIVFASGKDKCDLDNNICHINFKLSSKGEIITLTDPEGNIINKFTYPNLSNDMAYGYIKNNYKILDNPTPNKDNTNSINYLNISNKELYINEYMSHNTTINDSYGKYYDFVELYNNTDNDILLHNIFITDDSNNLSKYKLPDVTIKKNDYLLIYLADKSRVVDNAIYTNFKISDDEELIISNGKKIIDEIKLVNLLDNVSYGRVDNNWFYFTKATPGKENNTKAFDKLVN